MKERGERTTCGKHKDDQGTRVSYLVEDADEDWDCPMCFAVLVGNDRDDVLNRVWALLNPDGGPEAPMELRAAAAFSLLNRHIDRWEMDGASVPPEVYAADERAVEVRATEVRLADIEFFASAVKYTGEG